MSDLMPAATRLKAHVFGSVHNYSEGFVGTGKDRLWVYIHASENSWRGPKPGTWEDLPVEYRYDVGIPRAGL